MIFVFNYQHLPITSLDHSKNDNFFSFILTFFDIICLSCFLDINNFIDFTKIIFAE